MRYSVSSVSSILDIPDEMLTEIMLYLNARERITLANVSQRFYDLLFQNKRLLRNLDFTGKGCCSCDDSLADIKQYCKNPKRSEHALKVNLLKDRPTNQKSRNVLNSLKTVEDLQTQAVYFETIVQLGIFLDPFVHLERLSIEWPGQVIKIGTNLDTICKAWRAPFSRLRYLSVTLSDGTCVTQLLACLHLCQELKELHIIDHSTSSWTCPDLHNVKLETLKNLKIVVFSGKFDPDYRLYHSIIDLFTDPEEWIKLTIAYSVNNGLYFQRGGELSEMLGEPKCRYLSYDSLLELFLTKTHEIDQGDFCCLLEKSAQGRRSLFQLKMEEIKLLVEGPSHKTQYLSLNHSIQSNCIVHLVASAFPNLMELVLTNIVKITGSNPQKTHAKKRLRRKGHVESNDDWNVNKDSSFKMLVENTPRLERLTIHADPGDLNDNEVWDVDALPLIGGWKNLRSLCLRSVPIVDGRFLVVIGKQCVNLEKLVLHSLETRESCCIVNELCQMQTDCRNLRELTISE